MSKGENFNLFQKGLLLIGVPLILELTLVLILSVLIPLAAYDAAQARWRQEIQRSTDSLIGKLFEAFSTMISYGMDRKESTSQRFDSLMLKIAEKQNSLVRLCKRDKDTSKRLRHLNETIGPVLELLKKVKKNREGGAKNPLDFMNFMHKQSYLFKVLIGLRNLQHDMNQPQVEMEEIATKAHRDHACAIIAILLLGLGGAVVTAIRISNFFSRSLSSRILIIADNSQKLADKVELNEIQAGKDEVASLDRAFHEMVSVLQASAEKQNEIINNSEDVICALSESGSFQILNQAVEKQWGFTAAELLRANVEQITESSGDLIQHFKRLKDDSSRRPLNLQIRRKDGSVLDTTWSCHWSEIDNCYFCVVHDVSAQREQERVKAMFVGMISKQLRQPLQDIETGLKTLNTLSEGSLSAKGRKSLANSIVSSERIIQLVDELLELERMEQGAIELHIDETSTQTMVDGAVASIQSFAENRKIALITEGTSIAVRADAKRIIQVLVNFLSNAIKYSPQAGRVTIRTERIGEKVVLSVLDEGPGIPPEALGSLFARFKRLEREIDKTVSGTGLGLSICKLIIEQHGGEIGVENNSDKGSRFWFSIPN